MVNEIARYFKPWINLIYATGERKLEPNRTGLAALVNQPEQQLLLNQREKKRRPKSKPKSQDALHKERQPA
jgi:hypothetical protein